jgi:hypothetical protein
MRAFKKSKPGARLSQGSGNFFLAGAINPGHVYTGRR